MNRRKALSAAYKQCLARGGVYLIRNTASGRYTLGSAPNMQSVRNHFAFAQATNSAPHPILRDDWRVYGPDAFALDVLEELGQRPDQSARSFREDVAVLEQLWREKLDPTLAY